MKNFYYFFTFIGLVIITFFTNCDDEMQKDTTPPGQITNVVFTPLNGGGYFTFTIPADEDFLYVRAEYIIDSGELIS